MEHPMTPELAERLQKMEEDALLCNAELPSLNNDWEFVRVGIQLDIIEQVLRAMDADGIGSVDLAKRMDVGALFVHRLLNEKSNIDMRTLSKFAVALGRKVIIRLE